MVNVRGYLFIFLNAVRALSIISLLLLFSSSIVTMADDIKSVNAFIAAGKAETLSGNSTTIDCSQYDCDYIQGSTVPNQPAGAFWAVLNWLLVVFQSVVCILSEVGWPNKFFATFFPVLGPEFGLGALGVIQCLLGAAVLSHHVEEFALVSAFFVFSIGCLNILLGLIFRERVKAKRNIKDWKDGGKDVLPVTGKMPPYALSLPQQQVVTPIRNVFASNGYDEKGAQGAWRSGSLSSQKVGYGFGRQGEKFAANQGYVVREPEEAVPPYASKPASHASHGSQSEYSDSRPNSEVRDHDEEHDQHHERVASPVTNSSVTAI